MFSVSEEYAGLKWRMRAFLEPPFPCPSVVLLERLRQLVPIGFLLVAVTPCLANEAQTIRPNIVLVVWDAARADHLSAYGYAHPTTPNLERIASEGVLFETCIVAGPWTLPSMASLFTGLHPRDHRVTAANFGLSVEIPTLAEQLRDAGYATAGYTANPWVAEFTGLSRGFEEFQEVWRTPATVRHDEGAEITNEWIEEWLDSRGDSAQPFFLFALYIEPHFPYRPPPGYGDRFVPPDLDPSVLARVQTWIHPREVGYVLQAPDHDVSPDEFRAMRALYAAELFYVDERLGELTTILERRGLLDNTIFVITSDHGEHFGEHGFMDHKMTVYEEVIRVPLVIRYPPELPRGRRVPALVQNVDVAPSLLAWAGIEGGPAEVRLAVDDEGGVRVNRTHAFVEFARPGIFLDIMKESFPDTDSSRFDRALKAVRTDRHKLIWASDGRHELYDLREDPREARNVYPEDRELFDRLFGVLDAFNRGETAGLDSER
jgi:arylsulfatase A-like enzyme